MEENRKRVRSTDHSNGGGFQEELASGGKSQKLSVSNSSPAAKCANNELILAAVADRLPLQTLMSHRKVTRLWNAEFANALKRKHSAVEVSRQLEGYLNGCTKIPFTHYRWNLSISRQFNLLKSVGQTMKCLTISTNHGELLNLRMIRKIIFEQTPQLETLRLCIQSEHATVGLRRKGEVQLPVCLPKLKRLELYSRYQHRSISKLFADLLQSALNINYLNLPSSNTEDFESRVAIGAVLTNVQQIHCLQNLRQVKTSGYDSVIINALLELSRRESDPLTLANITVTMFLPNGIPEPGAQEYCDAVNEILTAHSATLTNIGISIMDSRRGIPPSEMAHLHLPQLDQLSSCALTGIKRSIEYMLDSRKANVLLPKLGKLDLDIELDDQLRTLLAHNKVSELHLRQPCKIAQSEFNNRLPTSVSHLARMFPCVVHANLKLEGRMALFQVIWEAWPALQTLTLTCQPLAYGPNIEPLKLDGLLSGVAESAFKALQHDLDILHKGEPDWLSILNLRKKYKSAPALGDLRHLKSLKIEISSKSPDIMTDIGGYLGVAVSNCGMQCISIKNKLSIPFHGITVKCRKFIPTVLQPFTVLEIE